jgi:serine/threonine-protein kinase HipA
MTLGGKRDGFTLADFVACAKSALLKRGRAQTIMAEVQAAVARWPEFAAEAQIADEWRKRIQRTHRRTFPEK